MEKFIFGMIVAVIAVLISSLLYGWMVLLNYSEPWISRVLILQLIGIVIVTIFEAGASSTPGASGWMLFLFTLCTLLLGVLVSIFKIVGLIFG